MSNTSIDGNSTLQEKNNGHEKVDRLEVILSKFPPRFQRMRRGLVYFGLFLSMFTIGIQATVIAPAMTKIATEMSDVANQTWIATGYLIAVISLQPLAGKLSDIFGRKPVYLAGVSFFVIGSLISALTPTINGLIAGRTIQGFGASSVMPMIFVIATDITPIQSRPRVNSIFSGMFGLASIVGPLLGGAFVDYVTWRWDFWLFFILGSVILVIMTLLFTESNKTLNREENVLFKLKRIDALGSVLVIATLCCLLLALNWGPMYGWKSAHSIASFVVAGVSLISLVFVESKVANEPILPSSLLGNWRVLVFYIYMCSIGLGFVGTLFYGPITYQAIFDADSTESGIRLIPYMGGLIVGAVFGGAMVSKFPYPKFFLLAGGIFSVLGFGLFQLIDVDSNWGYQAGFFILSGLGFGLSQQNVILAVQSLASKEHIAIATALVNFFMLLAPAVGLAVYQALFSTFVTAQLSGLPADVLAIAIKYNVNKNYLFIHQVPAQYLPLIKGAYMQALKNVFIPPIVASGIAIIMAIIMPNVRWGGSAVPSDNTAKSDIEATASLNK